MAQFHHNYASPAICVRATRALCELCPMDEEHKPVTIANVIAGEQTIATHCLACGHRGELDPRVGSSKFFDVVKVFN